MQRSKAPRLAIFNHKGGVGKTTLTFNIAKTFGQMGYKTLVVDSDPQCNLTSFFLEDSYVDTLLDDSDGPKGKTIWSALKNIVEGSGDIKLFQPIEMADNIFLIPGDIRLSEYEESLPTFWAECFQGKPKGYKGASALSKFINEIVANNKIDFIFYDTGPNIGALNKVILLDCDYFIVPAACDVFSRRAIKTLGHTLYEWIRSWRVAIQLAPSDLYILPGHPVFMGYIPQRFKTYGGKITLDYSSFIPKIEKEIQSQIIKILKSLDNNLVVEEKHRLGEVRDYGVLAANSQMNGTTLLEEAKIEGQKIELKSSFETICKSIIKGLKIDES